MKKIRIFFAVAILFCGVSAVFAGAKKCVLWEVKSPSATVYLMGSTHFADKSIYPLPSAVMDAFKKSDKLAVEVDTGKLNPAVMQQKMMKLGMYTPPDNLKKHISKATCKELELYAAKNGIPVKMLLRFRPGFISVLLVAMKIQQLGFSPDSGVDKYFLKNAGKRQVLELETFDDQLKLLFDLPSDDRFLQYTLRDLENIKKNVNAIITSWKNGDVKQLNNEFFIQPLKKSPELKPVYKRIFYDRNVKMAEKIKAYLKTRSSCFVVVGAGHLVGKNGIVAILQQGKYKIRQL